MKPVRSVTFALMICAGLTGCFSSGSKNPPPQPTISNSISKKYDWHKQRGDLNNSGHLPTSLTPPFSVQWEKQFDAPVNSGPAVAEGILIIGDEDGIIHALEAETGNPLWQFETGRSVRATALILESVVYIGSLNGKLYALNLNTGKEKWHHQTDDRIFGAASYLRTVHKNTEQLLILIPSYDTFLYAIDASNGKRVWEFETESYLHGSPSILADQSVVFGGCDNHLYHLEGRTGTLIKKVDIGSYIAATVAMSGNTAFFGHYDNAVVAIDVTTEKELWRYAPSRFPFLSSAAVDGNVVYVGSRDRKLHAIDQQTGKEIWTFQTQGRVDSSPVVCQNIVMTGSDDGRFYALDKSTGQELWSYDTGGRLSSPIALANNRVYFSSNNGTLFSISPSSPNTP